MKKLRAFVRLDSNGRVIQGSLILRKSKPKVGLWKEIESDYCCPSTTTITTTVV